MESKSLGEDVSTRVCKRGVCISLFLLAVGANWTDKQRTTRNILPVSCVGSVCVLCVCVCFFFFLRGIHRKRLQDYAEEVNNATVAYLRHCNVLTKNASLSNAVNPPTSSGK
jgi:hypothetical protein